MNLAPAISAVQSAGFTNWVSPCGTVLLVNADCLDVLPVLPEGCVDAVVTDPPYGIGIAANPVRQKHERMEWDNQRPGSALFVQLRRMSKTQIIWGGNYFDLPPAQCFLVWDKVQPENFSLAMCEQAWTNIQKPAKLFRRHVVSYEKHHPTQKPDELMEWCIGHCGDASTILDPFMGSGTTGVACARVGRCFIGVDVEPTYYQTAITRVSAALGMETRGPDGMVQRRMFAPEGAAP
jgi:site-specific DNA-methyltransferase (adenine-specific)